MILCIWRSSNEKPQANASPHSAIAGLLIRFLAFAAKCLTEKNAQQQALGILDDLVNESGWHTECVRDELLGAWGWTSHLQIPAPADAHTASMMNIIQFWIQLGLFVFVHCLLWYHYHVYMLSSSSVIRSLILSYFKYNSMQLSGLSRSNESVSKQADIYST